ncbi:O-antigen ligase family protein [Modicisalibacter coralii]|uniref:O-antigen ligase family protein n=1 Tax=Modicisalibacter coralii TaxID=2304602 RepID=UPI00139699E8|nr:O-antigen ligase family protein [Halomonas coralii]
MTSRIAGTGVDDAAVGRVSPCPEARRGIWVVLNTALVSGFLATLVVWPRGYALFPLAAALVAVAAGVASPGRWRVSLDGEDLLWLVALVAFSGSWLADVWRSDAWPRSLSGEGRLLPLWPLLAAALLIWLRAQPPRLRGWLSGLALGASGALAVALHERVWLGLPRIYEIMNAIPFGNLALLLGMLALVSLLGRRDDGQPWRRGSTLLLALASLAGLAASLLSGTRGGWLMLPLLVLLIVIHYRPLPAGRGVCRTLLLLGIPVVVGASLPQTGVVERLQLAVNDLQGYFATGDANSSLGLRLGMWRGGLALFAQHPGWGWGEAGLEPALRGWIAATGRYPEIAAYGQLHSDIVDTAARRGLVGLIGLGLVYGVPLVLFGRHLRRAVRPRERLLALSGLVVILAFVIFGLSQSMLRDARGLSGFLTLAVVCWALLKADMPRRRPPM